jgi:pyruvate formate lyase activating enzyme
LRDPSSVAPPRDCTAEELVALAKKYKATVMTSTYNEPLITSEWAVAVFKVAKQNGLVTSYVSNGNATPQVLDYIRPWVDLYKIDLKGFDDKHYRTLGGKLQTVLDAIKMVHERGFWLEVVTLVIPGFNDSEDELTQIAEYLVSVSPDIPWHVTAFHPDYKMTDNGSTPAEKLVWTCERGRAKGLRYCYAGNLPEGVGEWENTYCHNCRSLLIERSGYRILQVNIGADGKCPKCATGIAGRWGNSKEHQARWQNRLVTPV